MARLLVVATTTGYQTRLVGEAAAALGVELLWATDRCHQLDDPWRDAAIPVRFSDEGASSAAVVAAVAARPIDGLIALGDRPAVVAARVAAALGLVWHPPAAARAASHKLETRRALAAAELPVPWVVDVSIHDDPGAVVSRLSFPCVVKPLALSGSRGVIRADDPQAFLEACRRLARILQSPDVRAARDPANDRFLVEGFIPGREYALEGVLEHGVLRVLALFDKPDPLDGPFFEETIYTTPSRAPASEQAAIVTQIERAARAVGLLHGPLHAECRVNAQGVYVLEVAARPIGGLCARALRFERPSGGSCSLEELLLRHALGESVAPYRREAAASGVMMIPIPREGYFKGVRGLEATLAVPGITEVRITAKPDEHLVPLPEGRSYLGFLFARAETPEAVEAALRRAHGELEILMEPALPLVR